MLQNFYSRFVFLLLVTPIAFAQNINRHLQDFSVVGNRLELIADDGKYVIKPYSEKILETSFIPNGEGFNPDSHAFVLVPASVAATLTGFGASIEFATAGIAATITKSPFKISYSYTGKALVSEKRGYARNASGETLNFNLDTTEALYGAGARALGMNRRGNRLALYNKAHYG